MVQPLAFLFSDFEDSVFGHAQHTETAEPETRRDLLICETYRKNPNGKSPVYEPRPIDGRPRTDRNS